MLRLFTISILAFALLCPVAEARFLKLPAIAAAKKKPRHHKRKRRPVRRVQASVQPDWDAVMRRNSTAPEQWLQSEEYGPMLDQFYSEEELKLYIHLQKLNLVPPDAIQDKLIEKIKAREKRQGK